MTRMSESRSSITPEIRANPVTAQGGSALAHPVHDRRVLVQLSSTIASLGCALAGGACVFPPKLDVEAQDAGVNSPPAILGIRTDDQELPEPGPVIFDRGPGTFNAELIDTDVDDELFVRVFVDYTIENPTAPRVLCTAPSNGKATRTVTCNTNALCLASDTANPDKQLNMHISVFDREPLESGDPPFQAMMEPGLSTSRFYFLKCVEPQ
jgi:hypothetical protein